MQPALYGAAAALATGAAVTLAMWLVVDFFEGFAARHFRDQTARMAQLEFNVERLPYWHFLWGVGILAAALLPGWIFGMPPVGAVGGFVAFRAGRIFGAMAIAAREAKLRAQLAVAVNALASYVQSGAPLADALRGIHEETPRPLRVTLGRVVRDVQYGRPAPLALRAARDRLNLDYFSAFVSALLACLERGGEISKTLGRIAASLLERQRLDRKILSDTASGRLVVATLAVFPALFLALFRLVFPEGTKLMFTEWLGQLVLTFVVAITYASVRLSAFILDIKE